MKKLTPKEVSEIAQEALNIINDPEKYKEFKKQSEAFIKLCGFPDLEQNLKDLGKRNEEAHNKWAEDHPEQAACNHGIYFDKEAADKLIGEFEEEQAEKSASFIDPALEFIMGPSISNEIRSRWPRLCGECPKGCGYNGIYYASYEHYTYGDW